MTLSTRSLLMTMGMAGALAGQASAASPARAEGANAVQTGKELAVNICSPCHIVSARASEQRPSTPPGPSFAEIAQGPKANPEALRDFLHSTHSSVAHPGAMPNPQLTEEQIEAIAAYVVSLRRPK